MSTLPKTRSVPRRTPVGELMTRRVLALDPRTGVRAVAETLRRNRLHALPVVDADRHVMGLVTVSDLLARLAVQALPAPAPLLEPRALRRIRAHATGVTAAELMSAPARTVPMEMPAARAAVIALRHGVHDLPVVDAGRRLVGMVCVCDLALLLDRPDSELAEEARHVALAGDLGLDAATLRVACADGRLHVEARVRRRSQALALRDRLHRVEGALDVTCSLRWDVDDTTTPHRPYPDDLAHGG